MTSSKNIIYTTGALLYPQQVTDMLGNVIWMWTVAEFTDNSFKEGKVFNPPETAESLDLLITNDNQNERHLC
jgi:hypothetical protein